MMIGTKQTTKPVRIRQKLGKYKILRRLGEGAFAVVYQAYDTIEGVHVALKIPHPHMTSPQFLEDFRKEIRMAAKLDHPHILSLKNAGYIDGYFAISTPMGQETLANRLQRRMSLKTAMTYAEEALDAVAYAHEQGIIHCDLKPENFILIDDRLRLADFGIAKASAKTVHASGSGTIGFVAPEQAMGRPSPQSDVFALGLVIYRMLSGKLPEWPYDWPLAGYDRLKRKTHPDFIQFLKRALDLRPARRFTDATHMLDEFMRLKPRTLNYRKTKSTPPQKKKDWKQVRFQQFKKEFGKALETKHHCTKCKGPISEFMKTCPWCGKNQKIFRGTTTFPASCPRCHRGIKLDWRFCPWCYGAGFADVSERIYSDKRYTDRCANKRCKRKVLMPFMKYCPWCHRATIGKWKIPPLRERCSSCKWGVTKTFWSFCPWCSKTLKERRA